MKRIGLSKQTINEIAQRSRDIDPMIRETAFKTLVNSDPGLFASSDTLVQFLSEGLRDPVEGVRNSAKLLLFSWYKKGTVVEV